MPRNNDLPGGNPALIADAARTQRLRTVRNKDGRAVENIYQRSGHVPPNNRGFVLENFGVPLPEDCAPNLQRLRNSHISLIDAWSTSGGGGIFDKVERLRNNVTRNEGGIIKDVAAAAKRLCDEAIGKTEADRQHALEVLHEVRLKQQATWTPTPTLAPIAAELRAHLRSLSDGERDKLVNKLLDDGGSDTETLLYAIASAPPVLSGVHKVKHAEARETLLALKHPELIGQEAGLSNGIALIERGQNALREFVDQLVDFNTAEALAALEE